MTDRRVLYATAVYDHAEIEAVLGVLQGRRRDACASARTSPRWNGGSPQLFGKTGGVMCNSGSSALYLAVELLDLAPGSEVITSPLTFSTDLAPLIRAGLVPVFVDVEPDTFNVDAAAIEAMVGPRTRAILLPNLAGNAPDWDQIRTIADRHGLAVIEDSCDALGATLGGTPTGTRSDISVTSFALSHIITCAGNGGMVLLDDDELRDRCLSLRRWGRRSEPQLFGTRRGERNFWEDLDGIRYDSLFIFDDVAWNFEPSELGAAFGLQQLDKLPVELRAPPAQLHAVQRLPRPLPGSVRRAAPARRARHRVAVLRVPHPAGRRVRSQRPAAVPRAARHRHPHGLDRERGAPTDDAGRAVPPAGRRAPERRRGDGARDARADGSRAVGRRRGLRLRQHRGVPAGARAG